MYPNYNYNYNYNYNPAGMKTDIIKVRGYDSARSINLAPNSSILLLDEAEPIVWLCVSDGIGTVTATAYDIALRQPIKQADLGSIDERLRSVEESIKKIMEGKNESNTAKPKHNTDSKNS